MRSDDAYPDRRPANHIPLTPFSLLRRTAAVHAQRTSVTYGERRFIWGETRCRRRRAAAALRCTGICPGDALSTLQHNVPAMSESHFPDPMAGAVPNTINMCWEAAALRFILEYSESRLLLADPEFGGVLSDALAGLRSPPRLVFVADTPAGWPCPSGEAEYDDLLAAGDPGFNWKLPDDEWDPIALSYTSGTTGGPKGVVYPHRGAYLNALGNWLEWGMPAHAVYLWTFPVFHCNGWCLPWTLEANAGTGVCLRKVDTVVIPGLLRDHGVTHLCGALIVLGMLFRVIAYPLQRALAFMTAGASPPAALIERAESAGIVVTPAYGLTEVYGPAGIRMAQPDWNNMPPTERARLLGRQGVAYLPQHGIDVVDRSTDKSVPADAATSGEVVFRGNIVMKGCHKNFAATGAAVDGGWFHTDDIGVMHPDGYVKITDRLKDVIISGGENISSFEVEEALYRRPDVAVAAVVAAPDDRWGEVPCAYVELRAGSEADAQTLLVHCPSLLSKFNVPRQVVIGPVPKTLIGKVQKFVLRERKRSATRLPDPASTEGDTLDHAVDALHGVAGVHLDGGSGAHQRRRRAECHHLGQESLKGWQR